MLNPVSPKRIVPKFSWQIASISGMFIFPKQLFVANAACALINLYQGWFTHLSCALNQRKNADVGSRRNWKQDLHILEREAHSKLEPAIVDPFPGDNGRVADYERLSIVRMQNLPLAI